jgi:hypothetical protein
VYNIKNLQSWLTQIVTIEYFKPEFYHPEPIPHHFIEIKEVMESTTSYLEGLE